MPRYSLHENECFDGYCNIRKRVCSSPSSASSVLKNYRLKRTILVAKKGRSTTPVPFWRMNARAPHQASGISETSRHQPLRGGTKDTQALLSARKLGGVLWELNNISPQKVSVSARLEKKSSTDSRRSRKSRSFRAAFLPRDLSSSSNSPISESYDRRSSIDRRMMSAIHEKFHLNEYDYVASNLPRKANSVESEACSQSLVSRSSLRGCKNCLKELLNGLVSSKELLKILFRLCGIGKQQTSAISLATALYYQLDQVLMQVEQLIQENKSDYSEINCLRRRFMEEKATRKPKDQEGMSTASRSMIEQLEIEKKLRRRAERINKRLEMELDQMKTSLVSAIEELKNERKTREIIEQVSYQIIQGVGEDKAEVEELKRKSDKVREELEKEREMLQLADEWREERVHMKLSEAKHQFEEKNAAVDQLRSELEAFLAAKRKEELESDQQHVAGNQGSDCQREIVHQKRNRVVTDPTMDGRDDGEEKDHEDSNGSTDSEDSDLHSIELNINSGYNWSHACGSIDDDDKVALPKEKHEMRTDCEILPVSDFPLDTDMTKEVNGHLTRNLNHLDGSFDEGTVLVGGSSLIDEGQRVVPTRETYDSVGPRDQNSAGYRIVLPRDLLSSTRRLIRQQTPRNKDDQVCLGSKVAEIVKAMRESESKATLVRKNKVDTKLQMAQL